MTWRIVRASVALIAALVAVVLLSFVLATHADPGNLYVDGATGDDVGSCTDPGGPCGTIGYALGQASGGDTILVAQGVYTENITVDKRVTLQGGYESAGWTRDIVAYEAVIDGSSSRTIWGDWDGSGIHNAMVISDTGLYKMWYHGWGLTNNDIGLATSLDAIDWTKSPSNPVLTATVDWEEGDILYSHVIRDETWYKMWYVANGRKIGYAWSSDGINWTKYSGNPILEGTEGEWDEDGVGVLCVIKMGPSDYRMWYQDGSWTEIGYATSTDGVNWIKYADNPVLSPGPEGSWDDEHVADPSVLFDDGLYHMWYAGNDGDHWQIGYAQSVNGISWNKSGSNPVLSPGPAPWDEGSVTAPNVLFDGTLYRMWFTGWNGTRARGYATSIDGIAWGKYGGNPVLSPGTPGQWGHPVVEFVEGSDGSVLDAFTVQNGEAKRGGGVLVYGTGATIRNCTVVSNTAQSGGGGIGLIDARATAHANVILSNTLRGGGGAGILVGSATVTVTNNMILSNVGAVMWWDGDGIAMEGDATQVRLVNNTIAYNSAEGVQTGDASTVLMRNNIIVGNNGGIHDLDSAAAITIDHNDVWDNGWANYVNVITGTDDISADPLFVNAAVGDFHLRSDSPCIDAGTNVGAPDHDFEDDPRPDGCFADIGADEYRGRTCHRTYLPLMLKNSTPPVTLVWLVRTNPVENAWEQDVVIPAFEAQHPDIKINLPVIDQPDIGPTREEMIRKGQPLHVWSPNWGGDGFASDRHRGWLTDLTPLIERDNFDLSDFVPRTVEMYNIGGHQYGLPMLSVGSYVYYNADLFDAAGVSYPPTDWDDTSWTWEAMVAKAISLTHDYGDPDTGEYGVMTADAMEGPGLIFGQHIFPEGTYDTGLAEEAYFEHPKVIQAFQARHDLMYTDHVMPDAGIMDALSQLGGAFESGRLAMNQTGGWGYWNYKGLEGDFCWRVAPVPYGDPAYAGPRATVYTDPWVITKGTDHLDEAWEFVKYLVGPEASRAYMQATNVPPVRQSLLDEWADQFSCMTPAEVRECYLGAFDYGIESSNHLMIRWSELDGVYQRWMDILWNSPTTTASDLLPSLDADFEAILQKIKQEEE